VPAASGGRCRGGGKGPPGGGGPGGGGGGGGGGWGGGGGGQIPQSTPTSDGLSDSPTGCNVVAFPCAKRHRHTPGSAQDTRTHTVRGVGSATGSLPEGLRVGYRLGVSRKSPYSYEFCVRYPPSSFSRRLSSRQKRETDQLHTRPASASCQATGGLLRGAGLIL